jgi:hypothetical protein
MYIHHGQDYMFQLERTATIRTEWQDDKSGLITTATTLQIFYNKNVHTGWSKSLCAPDDYSTKNMQKYFKQFQALTMIMYFELGITDGISASLVSPWPWRSAAKQSAWAK